MASETLKKLEESLSKYEKTRQKVDYSVLVWGPGNDTTLKKKREEIVARLKEENIDAYTSEELANSFPSELPLIEQEFVHWGSFDLVVVLEAGIAPAMEIASFSWFGKFPAKCIVFHPKKWRPSHKRKLPQSVIGLFPYRVAYTNSELQKCTITEECAISVDALRRIKWISGAPGATKITHIFGT